MTVSIEKEGPVTIIILSRPEVRNAVDHETAKALAEAFRSFESNKEAKVAVFSGDQGQFCAGADLKKIAEGKPNRVASAGDGPMGPTRMRLLKPVIAAINGHVLAGGMELALSCQFRIMVDNPKLNVGLTELNVGIIPGWGGTQRLPRIVGKAKALDMILFSKRVTPQEALECGLVNQLSTADKLIEDAMAFAQALVKRPPLAVGAVLKAISAGEYEGFERGLAVEEEGTKVVGPSKDAIEGFTAFLEKREPKFTGE